MLLSAFPPSLPSLSSAFNGDFPPWGCSKLVSSLSKPSTKLSVITSLSDSDEYIEANLEGHVIKNQLGSEYTTRPAGIMDERKQRRMLSNRESARRSRMRKRKHLENLRQQVTRFRIHNRDLSNRLLFFQYHGHHVRMENDQLQSELTMLRQTLSEIRQILFFQQLQPFSSGWPCNTTISPQ